MTNGFIHQYKDPLSGRGVKKAMSLGIYTFAPTEKSPPAVKAWNL